MSLQVKLAPSVEQKLLELQELQPNPLLKKALSEARARQVEQQRLQVTVTAKAAEPVTEQVRYGHD